MMMPLSNPSSTPESPEICNPSTPTGYPPIGQDGAQPYLMLSPDELWWCNQHQRRATARRQAGFWEGGVCCDPNLGGTMLPCVCVNLTGIAEIAEIVE